MADFERLMGLSGLFLKTMADLDQAAVKKLGLTGKECKGGG
jgi:hypothetical protein